MFQNIAGACGVSVAGSALVGKSSLRAQLEFGLRRFIGFQGGRGGFPRSSSGGRGGF